MEENRTCQGLAISSAVMSPRREVRWEPLSIFGTLRVHLPLCSPTSLGVVRELVNANIPVSWDERSFCLPSSASQQKVGTHLGNVQSPYSQTKDHLLSMCLFPTITHCWSCLQRDMGGGSQREPGFLVFPDGPLCFSFYSKRLQNGSCFT